MKVLIVSTVGLIYDGITSVILSYLQSMDLSGLDVYVTGTIKIETSIRKKLEVLGCTVVDLPSRRSNTISYFFSLIKFIQKNQIKVIHAHGSSGTLAIEMVAAWLGGCRKRVAHSHNTQCEQVKANKLLRPIFNLFYTDALACGQEAGRWLFCNKPFTVLTNGRDMDNFSYNTDIKNFIRKKYGLSGKLIIGHVGGFFEQKNHKFLVKIFTEILKLEPTAKMIMIGDGPLKEKIESDIADIKDSVIFMGTTDKVADYLQAMDGMLLPSLFEGLPLVAVEWQINGLPCIFADTITKDCAMTDTVEFMSLNDDEKLWAAKIIQMVKKNNRAESAKIAKDKVRAAGFDIKDSAAILKNIYLTKR